MSTLAAAGLLRQTIRRRIRRGTWQEPLPGVVCRTAGTLTESQWEHAALLYGGETAALSHSTAGAYWDFSPQRGRIEITVAHGRHLRSTSMVHVHQSMRPFDPVFREDVVLTPPARTAVDMSLQRNRFEDVVALLGRALQSGRTTLEALECELSQAPSRGSHLLRNAMAEMSTGALAASEVRLWRLLKSSGLPLPELNAPVETALGTKYVDALWRQLRKGVEVDGKPFHLDATSWANDLTRQNAIQSTGIVLLRIAARRLWTESGAVLAEIAGFLGLSLS